MTSDEAALYETLVQKASERALISYSDAGAIVDLDMADPKDRNELAGMLDRINHEEALANRPMVSAIVVHADDQTPGNGFYECARGLGRLTVNDSLVELEFWISEVHAVFERWSI